MSDSTRNSFSDRYGELKAVEDFSIFGGFSCGHDGLDAFLFEDAEKNQNDLLFKIYYYSLNTKDWDNSVLSEPVAFVSLANNTQDLELDDIASKSLNAPHVKEFKYRYPAVSIGHMAVHADYQRQSVGTNILNLIKHMFITDNRTGCRFINLQAINTPEVRRFYMRNDFEPTSLTNTVLEVIPMFCDLLRF